MQFSENSRVWIYQADRQLSEGETRRIQTQLDAFTTNWTAHNNALKAMAEVRYNRFLILIVDESQAGASGCSIDKSVRVMKDIEQEFNINLFDRFNLAYRAGEEILSASRAQFEELIKQQNINAQTTVFNNTIQTLADLHTKWEVPFKDSWHQQLFGSLLNG
ncbi:hypothetical protein C8P68_11077 [Mucilaginibacter yixingensis]|uniref:ABC transporter ATPase n=1 Tax=Mucilaginibacter yixingensis TaxID=1295612 RepID=A0A2T5J533_9SPHI|nr:ABC transporter ATPase [Mucilaginibacter yixingensis]PTQ92946.1 hypothetical protein C8P68_11077 [Mucilaginibacter yixingensis]